MKKSRHQIWQPVLITLIYTGILLIPVTLFADTATPLSTFKGMAGTIKIAGGTAHIPVMKEAAQRIMKTNPDFRITIAGGGSGVGIKQVGEGLVDIGNSGRTPTDEEIAKYGLKLFKWAVDGVGIVVNPENPVKKLNRQQVKDIFAGKITNWKALSGPDRPINVYTRDESSGTRSVFWKKALEKGDIIGSANFVVSNGAMKTAIANDPYAIGYVSVGHIDKSVSPVAFDGVIPTFETVKNGTYPIARGIYSNTKGEPGPLTRQFIDYLFTPEGQAMIAQKGFVPVR
ncbi:MAG: phosphate ABC transporter substrate-binding protein [Thermodesulfobacteriota bacterium]|nr:phosphate ABC transporter substrate-binding protein [Thermodesulfobacteriota bacterium]